MTKNTQGSEWDKKFQEFWLPIITTDGKLDLEKIKNELYDFDFVIKQVPLVYDHVAGLSKVMYNAQTIIDAHDDRCHEHCVDKDDHEEELKLSNQALLQKVRELLRANMSHFDYEHERVAIRSCIDLITELEKEAK